jgi:ABC transport system ATP-binding/permease protein
LNDTVDDDWTADEDLVRVRSRRSSGGRIEIDLDEERSPTSATEIDLDEERSPTSAAPTQVQPARAQERDFEVVLQSAALLMGETRIPIPPTGLTIGASPDAGIELVGAGIVGIQAAIEATASGHVIVERAQRSETFVNGERLVVGERRPLRRGDSIALGGQLLHYLPAGAGLPRLAPVAPVDVGRLRTSKQEFTVGRDPECDLVLDHPTISRRHAVIRMGSGMPTIEDQGSLVGVRVNGEAVRRAPLEVGDQIAIGPYRIVFDGEDLFEREASPGLAVVAAGLRVDVEDGIILQPTSLHLRAGELVAIIGESGAGKSTLLRALAGVSSPTAGHVMIGGESVGNRLCELGYVPQFDIVHDQLTVGEALDFAAQLRLPPDTTGRERTARVTEVIDQLGLADRRDIRVERLSGGQRKRVAVGVELLHRPGALFLDEPTTGLDPGLERHMTALFRSLANTGQTVALVTHATGSLALYDRVIVMGRGGYLRFDGTPAELLQTFQVEQFDDVYTVLAERQEPQSAAEPLGRRDRPLPPLASARARQALPRPVQQTLEYQTRVLASRYALLVARDRRHLRGALIQVPILGLLTALLFVPEVFEKLPVPHYAAKSAQLIFLMVTIAVWLGSINAAREIVKERNVLDRELALGVQIPAYIASKLIVLLSLAAAQTVLFALIVLALRPLHETSLAEVELIGVLVGCAWIAVLLGLLVSAYATSEDQATGVIPLLLVPQLLFSGAIVPIAQMTVPVRLLAALIPARWSFAAAGNVIHMQERINADPVFSQASQYGQHFFSISLVGFVFICALFACALFAGLVRLLRAA